MRALTGLVLSGALLLAGCTAGGDAAPSPKPTTTPSVASTPSPTPTPVALPAIALTSVTIPGWFLAPPTVLAGVLAETGDAAAGTVAVNIDARGVYQPTRALETVVAVEPSTEYVLTAKVRTMAPLETTVPAVLFSNADTLELPPLTAEWQEVELPFETAAGIMEARVGIDAAGPFRSLSIDDIQLTKVGGANLITNGSFEQIDAPGGITNALLVLDTLTAGISVNSGGTDVAWELVRPDGSAVSSGVQPGAAPLTTIPLNTVDQGYYTLRTTPAGGAMTEVPLALVDASGTGLVADERFAVSLHMENPEYAGAARAAASLGMSGARNDLIWRINETSAGVYNWDARYTAGFDELRAQGIDRLGLIVYGNPLYDGGKTVHSPAGLDAFASYALAAAERFDLEAVEVFNEFNHERFNTQSCGSKPECYLPLLQTTYNKVKAVRPDTLVVAGSTALYDAPWFEGLWAIGGLDYSDVVSFHPYEVYFNVPMLSTVIANANGAMLAHGADKLRPIWITELGWSTVAQGTTAMSESAQAANLVQAAALNVIAGVERSYWYDLVDDSPDRNDHESNFGIFYDRAAGAEALRPKPAAFAHALMVEQLQGRPFTELLTVGDGVIAARFGTGEDSVIVAWGTSDGLTATFASPGGAEGEMIDLSGQSFPFTAADGAVNISITTSPVFLHGDLTQPAG